MKWFKGFFGSTDKKFNTQTRDDLQKKMNIALSATERLFDEHGSFFVMIIGQVLDDKVIKVLATNLPDRLLKQAMDINSPPEATKHMADHAAVLKFNKKTGEMTEIEGEERADILKKLGIEEKFKAEDDCIIKKGSGLSKEDIN